VCWGGQLNPSERLEPWRMQPTEIAREIGRLETGVLAVHRRVDDLRREMMGHIVMLHRKQRNGNSRKSPWFQIAAMGIIALSSILGLVKPEMAAALLRALPH